MEKTLNPTRGDVVAAYRKIVESGITDTGTYTMGNPGPGFPEAEAAKNEWYEKTLGMPDWRSSLLEDAMANAHQLDQYLSLWFSYSTVELDAGFTRGALIQGLRSDLEATLQTVSERYNEQTVPTIAKIKEVIATIKALEENAEAEDQKLAGNLNHDAVVALLEPFAKKFGDPAEMENSPDPEIKTAYKKLMLWQEREMDVEANTMEAFRKRLAATVAPVEAGFTDPDYLDEVANDFLVNELANAEEAGLPEVAREIKTKIAEIGALVKKHAAKK